MSAAPDSDPSADLFDTALPARHEFGGFLIAGAIGFVVDVALTAALTASGFGAAAARLPAILAALFVTWRINRTIAFERSAGSALAEFGRYLLVSIAGAGLNFLVFLLVTAASPAHGPIVAAIAVGAGSLAALLFNFLGYRSFAFAAPTRDTQG